MIGKLKGLVDHLDSDHAIIDVGGVGYLVHGSARTLRLLPPVGEATQLIIETHVREDHIHLYGFIDSFERDWFRLLTTVQGVGTRMALSILSAVAPEAIGIAIASGDKAAFTKANGVGPKLAQRILTELKDKVPAFGVEMMAITSTPSPKATAGVATSSTLQDALSALVNLGYGQSEAYTAIQQAVNQVGSDAKVEQLIPVALKELA